MMPKSDVSEVQALELQGSCLAMQSSSVVVFRPELSFTSYNKIGEHPELDGTRESC